jgi:hypothetical protein
MDSHRCVNYLSFLKAIIVFAYREGQRTWNPRLAHLEKLGWKAMSERLSSSSLH